MEINDNINIIKEFKTIIYKLFNNLESTTIDNILITFNKLITELFNDNSLTKNEIINKILKLKDINKTNIIYLNNISFIINNKGNNLFHKINTKLLFFEDSKFNDFFGINIESIMNSRNSFMSDIIEPYDFFVTSNLLNSEKSYLSKSKFMVNFGYQYYEDFIININLLFFKINFLVFEDKINELLYGYKSLALYCYLTYNDDKMKILYKFFNYLSTLTNELNKFKTAVNNIMGDIQFIAYLKLMINRIFLELYTNFNNDIDRLFTSINFGSFYYTNNDNKLLNFRDFIVKEENNININNITKDNKILITYYMKLLLQFYNLNDKISMTIYDSSNNIETNAPNNKEINVLFYLENKHTIFGFNNDSIIKSLTNNIVLDKDSNNNNKNDKSRLGFEFEDFKNEFNENEDIHITNSQTYSALSDNLYEEQKSFVYNSDIIDSIENKGLQNAYSNAEYSYLKNWDSAFNIFYNKIHEDEEE